MDLPKVEFLGPKLPRGRRRPTRRLVNDYLNGLREGLAPPSSQHLYIPSRDATREDLLKPLVREGMRMLEAYTHPDSNSSVRAVGMAYPQLARARQGSFRILAAQTGMANLRNESRTRQVELLINARYEPVIEDGWDEKLEGCFSIPGLRVRTRRWRTIWLLVPGKKPRKVSGNDAWVRQHEIDHLDGIVCVDIARRYNLLPLYFVPPEWVRAFYDTTWSDWPTFPEEQYDATRNGSLDLETYAKYL